MPSWIKKLQGKRVEFLGAGSVIVLAVVLAFFGGWPFGAQPRGIEHMASPSVWQYLFADRVTLGFARLAVLFSSLFLVASVAALGIAGRWMSGFGGLTFDEKESASERISGLESQLRTTQAQLDEEAVKRQEAEDWADALIDELDEVRIELDHADEELAVRGEDEHGDPGTDSNPA